MSWLCIFVLFTCRKRDSRKNMKVITSVLLLYIFLYIHLFLYSFSHAFFLSFFKFFFLHILYSVSNETG